MENEFEFLKSKIKYSEGKYLLNERKDNEIIILSSENSNSKQKIKELESTIMGQNTIISKLNDKLKSLDSDNIKGKKKSMRNDFNMLTYTKYKHKQKKFVKYSKIKP